MQTESADSGPMPNPNPHIRGEEAGYMIIIQLRRDRCAVEMRVHDAIHAKYQRGPWRSPMMASSLELTFIRRSVTG